MKDIYKSMSGQNILNYYGSKLDISIDKSSFFDREVEKNEKYDLVIDNSETYDFELDKSDWIDIEIDYSEMYDFQLYNIDDEQIIYPYQSKVILNIQYIDNYNLLTRDGLTLTTQNNEMLQFL